MGFWEEDHREEVLSHHILSRAQPSNMTYDVGCSSASLGQGKAGQSPPLERDFSSSLHPIPFGSKSLSAAHELEDYRAMFCLLKGGQLHKLLGILP